MIHNPQGFSTVENVPGMPYALGFVRAPEPKTIKNRIHTDLTVLDLPALLDMGATPIRPRGADIAWNVLADPEGNEFGAFVDSQAG